MSHAQAQGFRSSSSRASRSGVGGAIGVSRQTAVDPCCVLVLVVREVRPRRSGSIEHRASVDAAPGSQEGCLKSALGGLHACPNGAVSAGREGGKHCRLPRRLSSWPCPWLSRSATTQPFVVRAMDIDGSGERRVPVVRRRTLQHVDRSRTTSSSSS